MVDFVKNFSIFSLLIFIWYPVEVAGQQIDPMQALQTMSENVGKVKTMKYDANMTERIGDKMILKKSYVKLNVDPYKLFIRQGFPWIHASLNPVGKRIRNDHHHTIFELGYAYFVSVINDVIKKQNNSLTISFEGEANRNNRQCYKISITNDSFKYVNYTVKQGENLTSIAKKYFLNDYMLLEINLDIDYYDDVKPGQVIHIPNMYAKSITLFLDKQMLLPVLIDIYDDKGLYASYAYQNVVINEKFAWDEFNATFRDYHFK
jgi:outer membrane lipoprotein-sorting protein